MGAKGGRAELAIQPRKAKTRRPASSVVGNQPLRPKITQLEKKLCIFLAVATLLVYFRTIWYAFVFYDDDAFVYDNPVVKAGLKASGVAWAFDAHFANWHPLTWISYLVDAQLFGMHAGGFHAVNVLLHAGSVVLLFLALFQMTGKPWRCAVVAGIFALHPLHVESVAWIAERKDVLSTLFEMITLLLYAQYVEQPTSKRYRWVVAAFACSLMAKPMAVTFPFVLLLLDYWPLRRFRQRAVIEKIPLVIMSLAASIVTWNAQRNFGTVATLESNGIVTRIATAATGYVVYIGQAFWPAKLGVLYPNATPGATFSVVALLILLALTGAAFVYSRKRPYLLTGWLWYLGMLVPVIGLVQVGLQARADRYMYLPLVGLTLPIVWLAADWLESRPALRPAFAAMTGVVLVAFAAGAWRQVGYWKDSRTLFEHTLAVTERNYIIQNNLGVVLARAGDEKGAMYHYVQAITANPDYAEAKGNVGNSLLRTGAPAAARPILEEAIKLKPDFAMAQLDLGIVDASIGDYPQALEHLNYALRMNPNDAVAHSNLCYTLEHVGRLDEAIDHCRTALRLSPHYPDAEFNLKSTLDLKK
jgi:protein O-mannosyl-transferase